MSSFKSFEDMDVWQEARQLVRSIRSICKRSNVKHDFTFIDQVTRSVRSVPANIAEGFEAITNKSFITFLGYAKRSAGEVRSHLYDALDEQYIDQEEFAELSKQAKIISRKISKLILYLQSLPQERMRADVKA